MAGFVQVAVDITQAQGFLSGLKDSADQVVTLSVGVAANYLRDLMVEYAQSGHPEHPNVVSGQLSGQMAAEPLGSRGYEVGSKLDYAPHVEFGHMSKSWGHEVWHWVPPYPWFFPAVNEFMSGEGESKFVEAATSALGGGGSSTPAAPPINWINPDQGNSLNEFVALTQSGFNFND